MLQLLQYNVRACTSSQHLAYIPTWNIFVWFNNQCCAGWNCTLTLHNTVKWQKGRPIKVQLQSRQSISLSPNFLPFSHSAAREIGPTYCWMREKGFLASLSFDNCSGFCLLLQRCPFWYIETDNLIFADSALCTYWTECCGHSTVNKTCVILVQVFLSFLGSSKCSKHVY